MFIKRILIMSQTTFRDCRVHFCGFCDNLARNSCMIPSHMYAVTGWPVDKVHTESNSPVKIWRKVP